MTSTQRMGVDVGGTFTDFVRVGPRGLTIGKELSTPEDPSVAVLDGMRKIDPQAVLAIAHGTTVATNALLERRGARTAFVTTAGFADLLELGRGVRQELYSLEPAGAQSLVPPELCFEVDERVDAAGLPVRHVDSSQLTELARRVAASGAQSVAVCLLHSHLFPDHELAVGRALKAAPRAPDHVSLSVEVLPEFREYERASTVVANAYVAPIVETYLARLSRAAAPRQLTVMGSHGGTLLPQEATRLPAATVLSGPAAGVTGALAVARRVGVSRIITFDMGGTSTDTALCDGEVPFTGATIVGALPIHLPAVDIHTVGAGGGSVIWADEGGALRVGPESAGADPGPVSYGRGGSTATLTDAHVVLGRLPVDVPLAAGLRLDREAALRAIYSVGAPLGLSVEQTAVGAVHVANVVMERAIRRVSVERGFDPREFTLVAFGGAGPLHACELAGAIGVSRVLVPRVPGALSALGLAAAPQVCTQSRSVLKAPGAAQNNPETVFAELERSALRALGESETAAIERLADVRYVGQSWELTVPWPADGDPRPPFEAAHLRSYGFSRPTAPIEVVTLRVRVEAAHQVALPPAPRPEEGVASETAVLLPDGGETQAALVPRAILAAGETVKGPAVITQFDATTYVPPGWLVTVGKWGDLELKSVA